MCSVQEIHLTYQKRTRVTLNPPLPPGPPLYPLSSFHTHFLRCLMCTPVVVRIWMPLIA